MLYDNIQKYIESAFAELNNAELIRQKGKSGRMLLLIIIVAGWFSSEVLHFTTGSIPNLILVDMVTILFLAEYMAFSTIAGSRFERPIIYLLTFPLNILLLYLFVAVTGGAKSIFLILPAIYLLLVFMIDSLLPILLAVAASIIGIVLVYSFNTYAVHIPLGLVVIANMMVILAGIYLQYRNYVTKAIASRQAAAGDAQAVTDTTPSNSQVDSSHLRITRMKEILTKKEYEIVYYVIKGLSTEELSEKLFVEETTVKFHLKNIFKKLNITSKTDLIALFIPEETIKHFASTLDNTEKSSDSTGNLS